MTMGSALHVILLLTVIVNHHQGYGLPFPEENSDLCHSATCGLGATCSQVSNLIVCTCLDGYEGDAFKECIPASTTVSSQPSSSLPATTSQTTTTIASTTPTAAPSSTTTRASTTAGPVASTSETMFNIPVRTQTYHEVTRTDTPVQQQQHMRHQQEQISAVVTEDSLLKQYPSAPPTLSHYAPTFQQKLHAQPVPVQFGSGGHSAPSQSQTYPNPSLTHDSVVQQHRVNSHHGTQQNVQNQQQPTLFEGTRTRERPQPPQQQQDRLGPINGEDANEKYYYHDNSNQPAHNRNNYQGQGSGGSNSASAVADATVGSNSGSYNLPFNTHDHRQSGQQSSNYHGSQSQSGHGHLSSFGNSKGDVGPILAGPLQDYNRRPILGSDGNSNRYPITSSNDDNNAGHEDDADDDGMRDATFIKDPLGKYEKCHSVNNIVVCADNTNSGAASNAKHDMTLQHHVPIPTQKPLETRRIDSRPISANSNSNNYGMGQSRIPIFPPPTSSSYRPNQNYQQTEQHTTYYPNNRYPESSTNSHSNFFESQFPQRKPSQEPPRHPSVGSTTTAVKDPAHNNMCQRFCGEGSVCRIILDRPVCGCPEGHTGDATVRCTPILNSKYDTKSCQRHTDCPQTEVCHQSRCADPCDEFARTSRSNRCGFNASCRVIEHTQLCSCVDGFNGNPYLGCT